MATVVPPTPPPEAEMRDLSLDNGVPPNGVPPGQPPAPAAPPPVIPGAAGPPPVRPPASAPLGVIYPPQKEREIIDKTAAFVAKNGVEFEQHLFRQHQDAAASGQQQKFAFLFQNNPYRAYYDHKVKELLAGNTADLRPAKPQAILDQERKEEEKKRKKEQLKMLTMGEDRKRELKPPEPDEYTVQHPYIAPVDVDIIKMTAQFVARNGKTFLETLCKKEVDSAQFEFLKPTHYLFNYFTSLVDAYTRCLVPKKPSLEKLKRDATDGGPDTAPMKVLERCTLRHEWESQEEKKRKEKEQRDEDEKNQMQSIEWHDFIVVETIQFTEDDDRIQLAPPVTADQFEGHQPVGPVMAVDLTNGQLERDMARAGLLAPVPLEYQLPGEEVDSEVPAGTIVGSAIVDKTKRDEELAKKQLTRIVADEEEMEIDTDERPNEPPPPAAVAPAAAAAAAAGGGEEGGAAKEELPVQKETENITVVKDYVRQKRGRRGVPEGMQRCPITGQLVQSDDMAEHLRVLLLDPKWKEQKDRLVAKAKKESAFAPIADVEANIANFVARRPDLFGTVEDQIEYAGDPLGIEVPPAPAPAQVPPPPPPPKLPALPLTPAGGVGVPGPPLPPSAAVAAPTVEKAPSPTNAAVPMVAPPQPHMQPQLQPQMPIPASPPPAAAAAAAPVPAPPAAEAMKPTEGEVVSAPPVMKEPKPAGEAPKVTTAAAAAGVAVVQPPVGPSPHIISTGAPPPQLGPPGAPRPPFAPMGMPPFAPMPMAGGYRLPMMMPGQMPMMGMMPPGMSMPAQAQPGQEAAGEVEEPAAKRARTDDAAVPEEQFISIHKGAIAYTVECIANPTHNLQAGTLQVEAMVKDTVESLKEKVGQMVSLPSSRLKLKVVSPGPSQGVTLKDAPTLGYYNLGPETRLELSIKERGGKK